MLVTRPVSSAVSFYPSKQTVYFPIITQLRINKSTFLSPRCTKNKLKKNSVSWVLIFDFQGPSSYSSCVLSCEFLVFKTNGLFPNDNSPENKPVYRSIIQIYERVKAQNTVLYRNKYAKIIPIVGNPNVKFTYIRVSRISRCVLVESWVLLGSSLSRRSTASTHRTVYRAHSRSVNYHLTNFPWT